MLSLFVLRMARGEHEELELALVVGADGRVSKQ